MMGYGPHHFDPPSATTEREIVELPWNLRLVIEYYDLGPFSREMARQSAMVDLRKAAKCYAAIVRSLG